MTAIKSQLAIMSGTVPANAPQSQLARMVAADLKGGEVRHNFHMTIIAAAIVQALKGNSRDIPEAVKLCNGKSKKARAYLAGFQAVADDLSPVRYAGKLDAPENKAARDEIALRSQALEFAFESAFLTTLQAETAPKKMNKKEAAEDKELAVAAYNALEEENTQLKAQLAAPMVEIDTAVEAVCRAIDGGLLNADELMGLRLALLAHDNRTADSAAAAAIANAAETVTA
jgi:hypothetical protein